MSVVILSPKGVRSLVLLAAILAPNVQAEIFTWTDITLGSDAYGYPQLGGADSELQPPEWAIDQRAELRWNLSAMLTPELEFGLHYGLAQRWRLAQDDGNLSFDGLTGFGANYRWQDLNAELYSGEDDRLVLEQNLDRLYLLWLNDQGDLSVGRQAISFGLSQQFSPIDVVLPANIGAAERTYRPGVDAVRWLQPFGQLGELDMGWVFGEDQLAFVRTYNQVSALTLEFTVLTVNGDYHLIGIGSQGTAGTWGWWQEAAWLGSDEDQGARVTLGADQQVLNDAYVALEYHFNGLGERKTSLETYQTGFYRKGMVIPAGRHYASLIASKPINPLLYAQGALLANLGDGGLLLNAMLDFSLTDNSRLDISASLPLAQAPTMDGSDMSTLQLRDEFGVYPSRISVNWSTVF